MHPDDELPAGWLTQFRRGLLSGAGLLLLATGLCAIPAFAVWLVPGADTTPASVAVKAGALLALSGPHGGLVLDGTAITLTPLLITGCLGWLVASQARRAESWSSVLGLATGYSVGSGLLAGWARIGSTHAPVGRSVLAAWLFVLTVGCLARAGQTRWSQLPGRARAVLRAAGVVLSCYLLAGALLTAAMLVTHLSNAVAMQRQLAAGASGLPVALLGIAAAPNAVLAAVGYLTGPGFSVGSHTAVSVVAVSHGPLPTFPLLAAVPSGGPATGLGLLLIGALALLSGWLVLRVLGRDCSWPARIVDATLTAAVAGVLLAAASGLGSGGLGSGALSGVGESWWAVGACTVLVVLFGAGSWLAVDLVRARPVSAAADLQAPARAIAPARPGRSADGQADADAADDGEPAPAVRLRALNGGATGRDAEPPRRRNVS